VANYYLTLPESTWGRITVPHYDALDAGSGDFTIALWIKPAAVDEARPAPTGLVAYKIADIDDIGYGLILRDGKVEFRTTDASMTDCVAVSTQTIPFEKWTHIAGVIDRDGYITLYIDGQAAASTPCTLVNTLGNESYFGIGGREQEWGGYNACYWGAVDDLRIYKKALSASEVAAIYNHGGGRPYSGSILEGGEASAVFEFNEGSGTSTADSVHGIDIGTVSYCVWELGGIPFHSSTELIVYLPNHGYSNGDFVYVSWLNRVCCVGNVTQNTFMLYESLVGNPIYFVNELTSGYVQLADTSQSHTIISGLEHLEGNTVYVASNGRLVGSFAVSGGQIAMPIDATNYIVGLPYAMKARTMRLELPQAQALQSRTKRIHKASVRYVRSVDGAAGQEYDNKEYLSDLHAAYSTQSDDAEVLVKGGFAEDGFLVVRSDTPTPFTVLSASIGFSVDEPA